MSKLIITNLTVALDGKEILKEVNLELDLNKVNALMGPNGSGKSTLANVLMGHPKYKIVSGKIEFNGADITSMKPNERAKLGLFLSFQYPAEITGVTLGSFLRIAYNSVKGTNMSVIDFHKLLKEKMQFLGIESSFAKRYLNTGFSGGEKKKAEILQMIILEPKFAILDETDSGLDVDALKIVAEGINKLKSKMGILLITHYYRMLEYIIPDTVHILVNGTIVKSGEKSLAEEIEKHGYENMRGKEAATA